MAERGEVEVATQLAVDAQQDVQVEGGADAERIVVRTKQVALRLDQISANQQRPPGPNRTVNTTQQRVRCLRIEIANIRSQQQHQRHALGRHPRHLVKALLE